MSILSSVSSIQNATFKQDVNAKNIANISTNGYKAKRADTNNIHSKEVSETQTQGALEQTGQPLDLAIAGEGHFTLEEQDGATSGTRGGSFTLNADGDITSQGGKRLIPTINIPSNTSDITIEEDGLVSGTNKQGERVELGRILVSQGSTESGDVSIQQGMLESSNVDLVKEITDQIVNEGQLKANVASIKTQDEMLGTIIDIRS